MLGDVDVIHGRDGFGLGIVVGTLVPPAARLGGLTDEIKRYE